jgi:DUF2914 family protein
MTHRWWLAVFGILVVAACDDNKTSSGTSSAPSPASSVQPAAATTIPSTSAVSAPATIPSSTASATAPKESAGATPSASTVSATTASTGAVAPTTLTVLASQFTDRVESSKPVGDSSSLASVPKVTYWMDVDNPGDATHLTLVWKHDGKEVARQALDVGKAPHWRTWGSHPRRSAHLVEVLVLDGAGNTVKTDSVTLEPGP